MTKYLVAPCLLLCVIVACSASGSVERVDPASQAEPSSDGTIDLFPSFTLRDLSDEEVSLEELRGSVMLVVFWATWCPPCVAEVPILNRFEETYADSGLEVLAVAVDARESKRKIRKFVIERGVRYRVLLGTKETGRRYGVRGIPTTYLVGRDGEVLNRFIGYTPRDVVEQAIISALKR